MIASTPSYRMESSAGRRNGTSDSQNGRQRDDEHDRAPTREPGGQPLRTATALQFLEGMKLPALSLPRTSVTDQGPARLRAVDNDENVVHPLNRHRSPDYILRNTHRVLRR